MPVTDTIIAASSSAGPGLRAIIRLSGPASWKLAASLVALPESPSPGYHGPLALPLLCATSKLAALILFRAPHSFTGEDVAEIQLPNSPAVLHACFQKLLDEGGDSARLAGPGEFSARAFFSGKIDLTQAEGIAATINAASQAELRAATALRSGDLHRWIAGLAESIANHLALVEAGIDFVDEEDVQFFDSETLARDLRQLDGSVAEALSLAVRIDRLDPLPTVVLIGKPNVGKSTLINALAQQDRAMTSPVAGTTRDMLSAIMPTARGDVRLIDVPGEEPPADALRAGMMEARRLAFEEADVVVHVLDHEAAPTELEDADPMAGATTLRIQNKADLAANPFASNGSAWRHVSAKTGLHIDSLREALANLAYHTDMAAVHRLTLNRRHRHILCEVREKLHAAAAVAGDSNSVNRHPELLAADLRGSLDLLGQITGAMSPDDILGRVFSRFCIGK